MRSAPRTQALMARSGNVEVVAELAKELDFRDTDGRRPASIRSLQYLLPNFVFPQARPPHVCCSDVWRATPGRRACAARV